MDMTKTRNGLGKRTHKRTGRNFPENVFFAIETHYIAATKNITCNNSLKQTSERVEPPLNPGITYKVPVFLPV